MLVISEQHILQQLKHIGFALLMSHPILRLRNTAIKNIQQAVLFAL